ncbi:hypothetical protein M3P05_13545 [Sansalvadorimonas sp. 2012CJ34-2]|uniref:EF-hand domain-containing protein n=1 Tax=Parendozoicomonas callyspongiae TaxID=2942213 RepID=A0ABT0PHS8_9GAMM|nr:hypothetical protein [Sansalvadorimonas sp. 2012CJ34-2]MCL6270949.1 hypothetical protein [Sansalvadorimonas sp. 2012CJ34-2]
MPGFEGTTPPPSTNPVQPSGTYGPHQKSSQPELKSYLLGHYRKDSTYGQAPAKPLSERKVGYFESESKVLKEKLEDCLMPILKDETLLAGMESSHLSFLHNLQSLDFSGTNKATREAVIARQQARTDPKVALNPNVKALLEDKGVIYEETPGTIPFDPENMNHQALLSIEQCIDILETIQAQDKTQKAKIGPALEQFKAFRSHLMKQQWPHYFNEKYLGNIHLVQDDKVCWRSDLAIYPPQISPIPEASRFLGGVFSAGEGVPKAISTAWLSMNQDLLPKEFLKTRPKSPVPVFDHQATNSAMLNRETLLSPTFDDTHTMTTSMKGVGITYDSTSQVTEYDSDNPDHVMLVKITNLQSLNAGLRERAGDLNREGKITFEDAEALNIFLGDSDNKLESLAHEAAARIWPKDFKPGHYKHQQLVSGDQPMWCSVYCYPRTTNYLN